MFQVASALAYIHEEGIVHGDLRGVSHVTLRLCIERLTVSQANILIDRNGHAYISDFGLSVYANGRSGHYNSTRQGSDGWLAPELQLDHATGRPKRPTREGDVFSFAMSCIEVNNSFF